MKATLLTLTGCLFSLVCSAQDYDFKLDKEYKVSAVGSIDLNSSDAKVFITGSSRSNVHVKIERTVSMKGWVFGDDQEFKVEVTEESGNLKIRERKSGATVGVVGVYNEHYRIEIEAPEGMSLYVRGDDGDYYIKNINGSLDLSVDDADVELAACKGDKFQFRLDDGDLTMDQGKGSLEVIGDDSDVRIYNAKFSSIHTDVDDGDLIIETTLDDKGDYFFESEDGSISLTVISGGGEFDIRHDDANVISHNSFKTLEEGDHNTRLVLANGSAKVSMRADDARVKLAVR